MYTNWVCVFVRVNTAYGFSNNFTFDCEPNWTPFGSQSNGILLDITYLLICNYICHIKKMYLQKIFPLYIIFVSMKNSWSSQFWVTWVVAHHQQLHRNLWYRHWNTVYIYTKALTTGLEDVQQFSKTGGENMGKMCQINGIFG